MFQVDRAENRLRKLEAKRFTDHQLRERDHLQEWLANMPSALGEELLIIQKEFDGFDDTRERLDLLALDRKGQLVVIENKRDASGRDVVWQALKYAAFISTLKREQIVSIFQRYLDRWRSGGSAEEEICKFMKVDALDDVVLNRHGSQRVMLIAANFHKEVTATALWLLGRGIHVQCFEAALYGLGNDLLFDIRQIIPVPTAEEYMISMGSKDREEAEQNSTQRSNVAFWTAALAALRECDVRLFDNATPSDRRYIGAPSGTPGFAYGLVFGRDDARVELNLGSSPETNKSRFDQLYAAKEQIDAVFGDKLLWWRLDEKKASRIDYRQGFDCRDEHNWPEIVQWMVDHLRRMEAAFNAPLAALDLSKTPPPPPGG